MLKLWKCRKYKSEAQNRLSLVRASFYTSIIWSCTFIHFIIQKLTFRKDANALNLIETGLKHLAMGAEYVEKLEA